MIEQVTILFAAFIFGKVAIDLFAMAASPRIWYEHKKDYYTKKTEEMNGEGEAIGRAVGLVGIALCAWTTYLLLTVAL